MGDTSQEAAIWAGVGAAFVGALASCVQLSKAWGSQQQQNAAIDALQASIDRVADAVLLRQKHAPQE